MLFFKQIKSKIFEELLLTMLIALVIFYLFLIYAPKKGIAHNNKKADF